MTSRVFDYLLRSISLSSTMQQNYILTNPIRKLLHDEYIITAIRCQPYALDTMQKRFPEKVYFIAKEQNYIKINSMFGHKASRMKQYPTHIFMD
jgi:hypothetical protein